MIDLYTAPTPNGWKASITLEELELPYEVRVVDLGEGDQKKPDFQRTADVLTALCDWRTVGVPPKARTSVSTRPLDDGAWGETRDGRVVVPLRFPRIGSFPPRLRKPSPVRVLPRAPSHPQPFLCPLGARRSGHPLS